MPKKRVLISVSDKTGLLPLAKGFSALGFEILSTGGTAQILKSWKIPVQEVSVFTRSPEMLGGRVKTLHPKIHGGILADRNNQRQVREARKLGLKLIDLVVVNLYPFELAAGKAKVSLKALIEQIDIGGVALIRSAAKNFQSVGIVSRPDQYGEILEELRRFRGKLSDPTRKRLAVEAFQESAYYDSVIQQVLSGRLSRTSRWPERLVLGASSRHQLRYGENPHQKAAWYQWPAIGGAGVGLSGARQLHGKELSFNNLLDLDAAIRLAGAFKKPTAAVVKHGTPCGVASAAALPQALSSALSCDPISAFGGIVGFNRPVDRRTAQGILEAGFLECLVAPVFRADALKLLKLKKKNLRIIQIPVASINSGRSCFQIKPVTGGLLIQEADALQRKPASWKCPTAKKPTPRQKQDLIFAWTVCRLVRSNAIVLVKNQRTVGMGAGQTSRVDSVKIAVRHAGKNARGAVLASDGFFPKPDGPAAAVRAGIRAIVQPGGSKQDPSVIAVAQKGKIPMLLTGERHFYH